MSGFIAHILLSDNQQLCIVYEDKRVLPVCTMRRIEGILFLMNKLESHRS